MLIVKLETSQSGARGNQLIYPALEIIPEGWAVVPPELEAEALEFLPWMTVETQGGAIVGIGDDTAARARAEAGNGTENGDAEGGGDAGEEKQHAKSRPYGGAAWGQVAFFSPASSSLCSLRTDFKNETSSSSSSTRLLGARVSKRV